MIGPLKEEKRVFRIAIQRLENEDADVALTIANGLREAWRGKP